MYGRGSGTAKTATGGGMALGGRIALALLRTALLTTLAFLLLEPLIRNVHLDREEPMAILLIDESASIRRTSDSTIVLETLRKWPLELAESLSELGVKLETFGFSNSLNPRELNAWSTAQWRGGQTNLDAAIKELEARFETATWQA